MPHLFLTGYENETIEEFLKKLKRNGITTVIDVREIPLSRKNGFSKKNLRKTLFNLGIKYYHFPRLGSPRKIREDLKSGRTDYLNFFKEFRNYVCHQNKLFDQTLQIILKNKNTTLLCFEKESDLCHRSILASEILKIKPQIKIIPL
jgi:uncharacterized protein (DUF488 family)